MTEIIELTHAEIKWIHQLAERLEKIFAVMGWTWKPKNRRFQPKKRSFVKLLKDLIPQHKEFPEISGGIGRVYVEPETDEFGELMNLNVLVKIGSLPIENQDIIWEKYGLRWNR